MTFDVCSKITLENDVQALMIFDKAQKRMLDVEEWNNYGQGVYLFKLLDSSCKRKSGLAAQHDILEIIHCSTGISLMYKIHSLDQLHANYRCITVIHFKLLGSLPEQTDDSQNLLCIERNGSLVLASIHWHEVNSTMVAPGLFGFLDPLYTVIKARIGNYDKPWHKLANSFIAA